MLSSITPLGERGRRRRWGVTVTAYVIASAAGGAVIGAASGGVGAAVTAVANPSTGAPAAVLAALIAAGAAFDLRLLPWPLPTVHRQVDENWLHSYRGSVYGAGFGFQLGLGVVTIVTTSAVYLTLATALLTGSVAAGTLIGTTFGLVRALPVLALRRVTDPQRLRAAHRRVHAWGPVAQQGAAAALVVVAAAALAYGLLPGGAA